MKDKKTNSEMWETLTEIFKPIGLKIELIIDEINRIPKSDKEESECNES